MRQGSLSERLSRLRTLKETRLKSAAGEIPRSASAPPDDPARDNPAVPEDAATRSPAAVTALEARGWERTGEYSWKKSSVVPTDAPGNLRSLLLRADNLDLGRLVFFDTETTGLSGGAGNYVFLLGAGRLEACPQGGVQFRIDQHFLSDFPGERDFLCAFMDVFSQDGILVSYNGKTFDCGILSTRFIMNGMRLAFGQHLDLLYPARMLWKSRLPSCSLTSIERSVLAIERIDDVPGSQIPDLYFRYLKTGDAGDIEKVFDHNRFDIANLLALFLHMEQLFCRPEPDMAVNIRALGKFLLLRDAPAGERLLRSAWEKGDTASGRMLGLHYRRTGEYAQSAAIWESLYREHGSIAAAVELAKIHEHRTGNPSLALAVVEELLSRPKLFWNSWEESLVRRRFRLLRKIEARKR